MTEIDQTRADGASHYNKAADYEPVKAGGEAQGHAGRTHDGQGYKERDFAAKSAKTKVVFGAFLGKITGLTQSH